MADTKYVTFPIAQNDETEDNGYVTPGGGAVLLELNRGFTTTIPNYRVVICLRTPSGELQIERNIGAGAYPSPQDPNGPPPKFNLGTPNQLKGRIAVVVADGIALPPNAVGQIDLVVDVFQQSANAERRVGWSSISDQAIAINAGRFEITFQSQVP